MELGDDGDVSGFVYVLAQNTLKTEDFTHIFFSAEYTFRINTHIFLPEIVDTELSKTLKEIVVTKKLTYCPRFCLIESLVLFYFNQYLYSYIFETFVLLFLNTLEPELRNGLFNRTAVLLIPVLVKQFLAH